MHFHATKCFVKVKVEDITYALQQFLQQQSCSSLECLILALTPIRCSKMPEENESLKSLQFIYFRCINTYMFNEIYTFEYKI